jgi:hypothetical protein
MEYMGQCHLQHQFIAGDAAINANAVSIAQMILSNSQVLLQEVPTAKDNSDFMTGVAALKEKDGKKGAIARYVLLQDKRNPADDPGQQLSAKRRTCHEAGARAARCHQRPSAIRLCQGKRQHQQHHGEHHALPRVESGICGHCGLASV